MEAIGTLAGVCFKCVLSRSRRQRQGPGGDSCRPGEKFELAGEKIRKEGGSFETGPGRSGGQEQGDSGGLIIFLLELASIVE